MEELINELEELRKIAQVFHSYSILLDNENFIIKNHTLKKVCNKCYSKCNEIIILLKEKK